MIIRQLTISGCAQYEQQLAHDRRMIEHLMGTAQTRASEAERETLALGRALSSTDSLLEEVRTHRAELEAKEQEPAGGKPERQDNMET